MKSNVNETYQGRYHHLESTKHETEFLLHYDLQMPVVDHLASFQTLKQKDVAGDFSRPVHSFQPRQVADLRQAYTAAPHNPEPECLHNDY